MKKKILLVLSILLIAAMAITGTVAYLTDEVSDINVMTVGNVHIQQLEYERDANGNLQPYTQDKPIVPAVYEGNYLPWADGLYGWDSIDGVPTGAGNQLFKDGANAVDKFVFVQNVGNTDAYYRTVIAIESPVGLDPDYIHININGNTRFTWTEIGFTEINGVQYYLIEALYNEILVPGETSRPSLMQVYLDKAATNADVELLGDTFEILAVSQAVQAGGFADSNTALDTAFYDVTTEQHPWLNGANTYRFIRTEAELNEVGANGSVTPAYLGNDIVLVSDEEVGNTITADLTLNLNGHTVSTTRPYVQGATIGRISTLVASGCTLTIEGDGTVINDDPTSAYAIAVYDGATVVIKGGNYYAANDAFYVREGTLIIEDGFFNIGLHKANDSYGCWASTTINCYDDTYLSGEAVIKISGGTFVNFNPADVHEGKMHHRSFLEEGYTVVAEPQANGDIWYTVVPE